MKLSVSQLKSFNADPYKWYFEKVLKVKKDEDGKHFAIGSMVEHWLCYGEDKPEIMNNYTIADPSEVLAIYGATKNNATGIELPKGKTQVKYEGEVAGVDLVGYADLVTDDTIIDIKTSSKLTKTWDSVSPWSGLSASDEYELQLRVYMYLADYHKASILQVSKAEYKSREPGEGSTWQRRRYERTPAMDKKRTDRISTKAQEMEEFKKKTKQAFMGLTD